MIIILWGQHQKQNNLHGSQTQTLTREKEEIKNEVEKELDDKICELPGGPLRLELGDRTRG